METREVTTSMKSQDTNTDFKEKKEVRKNKSFIIRKLIIIIIWTKNISIIPYELGFIQLLSYDGALVY